MKRFLLTSLLLATLLAGAQAQNSPAQLSVTPLTLPEVLQVLDNTQTWVPIGDIDPVAHVFTPLVPPLIPPATSRINDTAQNAYVRTINAAAYGARGSSQTTTGAFASPTSNVFTLASPIDFQAGDDISIRYESLTAGPPPPSAGTATPCGTPRSILTGLNACAPGATACDYYAVEDDGWGGHSAPIDIHATNLQAAQTVWQDVYISMVPAVNNHTAPIWKNCGSGDAWIGAAQPRTTFAFTPGSGYANGGPYFWSATGGGCTTEPTGWVVVVSGALYDGGVDADGRGAGCTSPPTVNVAAIPGIGAGAGATITLGFLLEAEDAGYVPNWLPMPYQPSHPTLQGNDDLIATIGSLSGAAATLCQLHTGIAGVACIPAYGADTISRSTFHSWTGAIQDAINAAANGASGAGVGIVHLQCGAYDGESGKLTIGAGQPVLLQGDSLGFTSDACVRFVFKGNRPDVTILAAKGGSGVENINFDGTNKTGAGFLFSDQTSGVWVANINQSREPCPLTFISGNNVRITHAIGSMAWGYRCATYAIKSTAASHSWVPILQDVYENDSTGSDSGLTANGGLNHDTFEIDGVPSGFMFGQVASSDAWGHGYWFHNDTGYSYNFTPVVGPKGNQFWHIDTMDAEFDRASGAQIDVCIDTCTVNQAFFYGSVTGNEFYLAQGQQWTLLAGKASGGAREGVWSDGSLVLSGMEVTNNSGIPGGSGTYCGVYLGPHATSTILKANQFSAPGVRFFPPAQGSQMCPVQIASANTTGTIDIEGNTFDGSVVNRVLSDIVNPNDTTNTVKLLPPQRRVGLVVHCNPGQILAGQSPPNDCMPTLAALALPLILPSSGTMANNGAVTFTTPLDLTYPRAYVYMPAGAIATGSTAGWYYATCTSTTQCTLFNNIYTGNLWQNATAVPAAPTPFVTTGPGAYAQTTAQVTSLKYNNAPYQYGPYDGVQVQMAATMPATAGTKTITVAIAGWQIGNFNSGATNRLVSGIVGFRNLGVTNLQQVTTTPNNFGFGSQAAAPPPFGAIDFTAQQSLNVNMTIAAATDYLVMQTAVMTFVPGAY